MRERQAIKFVGAVQRRHRPGDGIDLRANKGALMMTDTGMHTIPHQEDARGVPCETTRAA
jgi:hypothetical protein